MTDFVIPVARGDLLKRATSNAYVVNEVFAVRNIRSQLPKCLRILASEGYTYILRAFDILFSVLQEWQNVDTATKEEAWHTVLKGCEVCVRQLGIVLESCEAGRLNINRIEMATHRNSLKMHTYLLCQFVDMFENELNAHAKSNVTVKAPRGKGGRGGRRGAPQPSSITSSGLDLSIDWINECEKAINALDQLCRLQLGKLWDPPIAEEDFVNLPANCCYKLLEDRAMASSVNIRTAVTRLLSSLVRRYGHSIACSVKLAQLLQCFPHMVNCLLAIVRSFVEEENMTGVVRELLKEICSYNGADLDRDAQATQNFSGFLLEVASAYPVLAQSILPLLRPRLDEDPYQMRNCALGVIGEVIPAFARREQLDPKERVQRDRLMDLLQEHIHDVNGYVRAKALQIWHTIVSTGGLPVRRQSQLAALLVGPLGAMQDVSSLARKYACKTLTAMVLQSPAAKLTPTELEQVLSKETQRLEHLEELLAKVPPCEDADNAGDDTIMQQETDTNEHSEHRNRKNSKTKKKISTRSRRVLKSSNDDSPSQDEVDDDDDYDNGNQSGSDSGQESLPSDREDRVSQIDSVIPSDAAAALEAAIHSAAAAVSASVNQPNEDSNSAPMRSATVAHAQLTTDLARQRACVAYLRETNAFSAHIQNAIKDFQTMLVSKTLTDVTEAIDFFVVAKQSGVKGIERGIRQLLIQVWSQDEPIRKAVIEACRKLYLQPDPEEPGGPNAQLTEEAADSIATNLSRFIRDAEIGDLVSLERIIQNLIDSDQFDRTLEDHLWKRFQQSASKSDKESADDAKSMLLIIKMIVRSDSKEFDRHLDTLMRLGLESPGDSSTLDLERVQFTCDVLLKMIPKPKPEKSDDRIKPMSAPFRLPTSHNLFSRLRSILISSVTQRDQDMWIPMMEKAITTIYDLAESPDSIATNVIRAIAEKLVHSRLNPPSTNAPLQPIQEIVLDSQPCPDSSQLDHENQIPASQVKPEPETPAPMIPNPCPAFLLSRFLALVGHVCLKQLVHLESSVLTELKRRATIKEDRDSKRKSKPKKNARQSRMSMMSVSSNLNQTNSTGQMAVDEESGLVGVQADDTEADYIRHICEQELIKAPNHVLTPLLNLVTHICSNPTRYSDDMVQASASLALAKMMLVNAEVCEPRLQLLFTLAERSQSEIVRANLVVALGDLCRRFPNLIEPWTPNLYARLRDSSAKVRTNALNALSHLILNDMVKVKGQISEMTVCLVDDIERLNVLARRFFRELAQKGNALYNIIPDIVSRLSDPEIGVSEEHFHTIMEFLIPLIGRERLCETLVEKICARFRATTLQRQWRDLAHTLTIMSFNERMMRVLYENLPAFADKLCVAEVYSAFDLIINNAKKSTKPDGMARLEEFEAKVREFHEKGTSDEAALRRAEIAAKAMKQKSRKNRTSTSLAPSGSGDGVRRNLRRFTASNKSPPNQPAQSHLNDDQEEPSDNSDGEPQTRAKGQTKRGKVGAKGRGRANPGRGRARVRLTFSSDESASPDEEDDEND